MEEIVRQDSQKKEIDLLELFAKIWDSRILVLKACAIGAIVGLVMVLSIPKEYTAEVFMTPEYTSKHSSSDMSTLADMAGVDMPSVSTGRDAIYPSLYPIVVKSTPFLTRLFNIKVREQKDSTSITLSQYLKERQKRPWWSIIKSVPSKLIGWAMSLFREKTEMKKMKSEIDLFHLTREEMGMAGAIASRIKIEIEKKRRTITIFVTMQDPLVAAVVADTVRIHLQDYITKYRTEKARKVLEYREILREEAQAEFYDAQEKYTRYVDANQGLVKLTLRAEQARLRNEMNLAQATYNQAEQQVQLAKVKVEKVTPLYAIIQPASVPLGPSKPNMMTILLGSIFLCGAGSISWILFAKDFVESFLRDIRRKRKTSEDEYNQMVADD